MPDHATHVGIGPNALTQLFEPIRKNCGEEALSRLLLDAGIIALPDMLGLMDEAPVIRFHTQLHYTLPEKAHLIERQAGIGTAKYILENRIPKLAQFILKALPKAISARILSNAINHNAWTFAGSGSFRITSRKPIIFSIVNNPLVRDMTSHKPLCVWHEAVFETLFQELVSKSTTVREVSCCACGDPSCQFEVFP